jgi:hypothetical protein
MRTSNTRWIPFAACFLLCALGASAATPEFDRWWTTVGSAGTLDEDSEGKVVFNHAVVQKGDMPGFENARRQVRTDGEVEGTDSAVIRYNVTAVDGLFGGADVVMTIRFRDEGKSAGVVARLIEVDLNTGAEVTLLTFDSNAGVPVQSGYHVHEVFDCHRRGEEAFDFTRKAYYIEATLTTSSLVLESVAGIEIIQVRATSCD